MCSSCNDLQRHLTRYSNFTALFNALNVDQTVGMSQNGATLRTDNNLIINNADSIKYVPLTERLPWPGIIYMTTYGTGNSSATASFKDNDLLIWSTSILRLQKITRPDLQWPDLPIEALECALCYCIKRYNASVYNGVFDENETTLQNVRRSPDSWQISRIQNIYDPESTRFANGAETRSLEYSKRTAGLAWSDLMLESDSGSKCNV